MSDIDESLFGFDRRPSQYVSLKEAIGLLPEVSQYSDFFIKYCQPSIKACASLSDTVPVGKSKFGGAPDFPEGVSYPLDKDGRHFVFHAQINLEELADLQEYLPRAGMLYFFMEAIEGFYGTPFVFYHKDSSSLIRYRYPKKVVFTDCVEILNSYFLKFFESVSVPDLCFYEVRQFAEKRFPELVSYYGLNDDTGYTEFEPIESASSALGFKFLNLHKLSVREYSIDSKIFSNAIELNGLPRSQSEIPTEYAASTHNGSPSEWLNLLSINSFCSDVCFGGHNGALTYNVKKADLAALDFSKVVASISV